MQFSIEVLYNDVNLELTNVALLTIFILEVSTRFLVTWQVKRNFSDFFLNPFNILDLAATLIDLIVTIIGSLSANYGTFGRLGRTLRILRLLRLARLFRLARFVHLAREEYRNRN